MSRESSNTYTSTDSMHAEGFYITLLRLDLTPPNYILHGYHIPSSTDPHRVLGVTLFLEEMTGGDI